MASVAQLEQQVCPLPLEPVQLLPCATGCNVCHTAHLPLLQLLVQLLLQVDDV